MRSRRGSSWIGGSRPRRNRSHTVPSPLGRRIHVIGNSGSGKSTLAERLAGRLGVPFVELDALNWEPGWYGLNEKDPAELERRFREATAGEGWVVAGSYSRLSKATFWARLETVVWLDLPMPVLLWRVLTRSWRRWRTRELLWGTNYESFWRQLMVWRGEESLVWWIVTQHRRKRRQMLETAADPRWSHIRFVRLRSAAAVRRFLRDPASAGAIDHTPRGTIAGRSPS
jgi:adenylate kinase family enzyme